MAGSLVRRHRAPAQPELPVPRGRDPGRHAEAFDAKIRHELDAGTYTDPSAALVTFREYAEQWRALRIVDDVTAAKYEASFRNHVYPAIGNVPLRKLSRAQTLTGLVGQGPG